MRTIRTAVFETPLGAMLGAAIETEAADSVCLLEFTERRALPTEIADLERRLGATWSEPSAATGVLRDLGRQLQEYFARERTTFELALETPGPAFHARVWEELRRTPYGKTISYIELARRLGNASGSRAVGQANGANRIAIVIPCHRVIAADGGLGGYGGRLWRKQRLLELEGVLTLELFPT
jgi:AraC family transcriptional regulator of adaptative response/methylated-DNA-[protein]-cysteine methyltransferase